MKLYDAGVLILIVFVGICAVSKFAFEANKKFRTCVQEVVEDYPSDNLAEEAIEDVIEAKTGMDVDISFWDNDEDKCN